jgi:hypothetical protein
MSKRSATTILSVDSGDSVFELPGGWGLNPPVVCLTPKQDALGYPGGGVSFNPPAVVNDAQSPVCNDNDNE